MLRRLNVSAKVKAVVAVPMLVLLVAGSFIGWEAFTQYRSARASSAVVSMLSDYTAFTQAVQRERIVSLDPARTPEGLTAARAATDTAATAATTATAGIDRSGLDVMTQTALDALSTTVRLELPRVRARVDAGQPMVASGFGSLAAAPMRFVQTFAEQMSDRTVAPLLDGHATVLAFADALVVEQLAGSELLRSPGSALALAHYREATAATETARMRAAGAADEVASVGDIVRTVGIDLRQMRSALAQADPGTLATISTATWDELMGAQTQAAATVDRLVLDSASLSAESSATTVLGRMLATLGVIVLATVASFLAAGLVARRIVVPLTRLTAAADQVRQNLPLLVEQVAVPGQTPDVDLPRIPVESDDEVGRLATAFNEVNATTLQVAQAQAALRGSIAEMFVNVARRDQVLLNRQLAFVDTLERTEEDPTALANLFHLDHLATRMRRNAESLLVLAGIDSGRRLREPMPLSDVIRTASSEIEQYDRVELNLTVDPHMLAFNALPAAHLLAELLENSTVFSEPETPVEVATGYVGELVVVTILDHGIGMSDVELETVNERLGAASAGDALGAQRLGLYVVARLARRLGAEVEMRRGPSGSGTLTVVRFPAPLFQSVEALPGGAPLLAGAPDSHEVDLAGLTDGATDRGLPRRRTSARDDEEFVLPAVAGPASLETGLAGAESGWSPLQMSTPTGGALPARARTAGPAAPEVVVPPAAETPAMPVDQRRGLFGGFRGWSRPGPGDDGQAGSPVSAPGRDGAEPGPIEPGPIEPGPIEPGPIEAAVAGPVPESSPAEPSLPDPSLVEPSLVEPSPVDPSLVEPSTAGATGSGSGTTGPTTGPAEPAAPSHAESHRASRPLTRRERRAAERASSGHAYDGADVPPLAEPAWPGGDLWAVGFDESATLAFDPIALVPDDDEAPYSPQHWPDEWAHAAQDGTVTAGADDPWSPALDQIEDEDLWSPVLDLSETRLTRPAPNPDLPAVADLPAVVDLPSGASLPSPLDLGAAAELVPGVGSQPQPVGTTSDEAGSFRAPQTDPDDALPTPAWWAPVADPAVDDHPQPTEHTAPAEHVANGERIAAAEVVEAGAPVAEWGWGVSRADDAVAEPASDVAPPEEAPASPWPFEPVGTATANEQHPIPAGGPTTPQQPGALSPVEAQATEPAAVLDEARAGAARTAKRRWGLFRRGRDAGAVPTPVTPARSEPTPVVAASPPTPAAGAAAGWHGSWAPAATPPVWDPATVSSDPSRPFGATGDLGAHGPSSTGTPVNGASRRGPSLDGPSSDAARTGDVVTAGAPAGAWTDGAPGVGAPTPGVPAAHVPTSDAWTSGTPAAGLAGRRVVWGAEQPAAGSRPSEPTAGAGAEPAISSWRPVAAGDGPATTGRPLGRIGTVEDDMSAMLALRSGIEEQALSELSQLSSYRPTMAGGSERLAKRVPGEMPPAAPAGNRPVQRDADELRARLASFQSGSHRGRRAGLTQPVPEADRS